MLQATMARGTVTAAILCLCLCLCASGAVAGPSLSTNWTQTTLERQECLRRAERVIRNAGLGRNFEVVGQSAFGQRDSYTAVVRCITDKGIVYFAVGGPAIEQTRKYLREMFDNF